MSAGRELVEEDRAVLWHPFTQQQVEPGDAAGLERLLAAHDGHVAAVVVEPLVQGAAGMHLQPAGYLRDVATSTACS